MIAIHPSHVATVNEAFTASAEDIEFHEGLVAAYEQAAAAGHGAVRYRGVHIDKAHDDTAREWLARVRPGGAGPRTGGRPGSRRRGLTSGLYFEEFEVGRVYKHPFTRTVTESDNVLFTSLTMNPQPLHLDHEFAKKTIHGRPLFNSLFTLALVGGFHVLELTFGTTLGNLGYDSVKFPNPVFHGDTLRGETTILDKREGEPDRQRHRLVRAPRLQPAQRGRRRHGPGGGLMARRPTSEPETPSPQGDLGFMTTTTTAQHPCATGFPHPDPAHRR